MRAVSISIFLIMFMVIVIPICAQDYGTHIPLYLDESVERSFWRTDWSPDGKWIAFDVSYKIFAYNLENGEIIHITNDIEERCGYPCFTPDSQEISFSPLYEDGQKFGHSTVEAINIYTGEHRLMFDNAYAGSWSYDGSYFIYNYYPAEKNRNYAIFDYDSDETTYYNYSSFDPPKFGNYPARMSPDNTYFISPLKAHNERKNPVYLLYRVDIDSSDTIQMDMGSGDIVYAEYSPDGIWVAYTEKMCDSITGKLSYLNVGMYNTETGEIFDLVPDSEYYISSASWSPDGTKLCYILRTENGGELYIKDFEYASEPTCVSHAKDTPVNIVLHSNFPNPFNPSTTIEFTLPEAGFADLAIYNVMGQKVRELISGQMNQGIHSINWDGRNEQGLPVSAGVYVSRLRMEDVVRTGRMMLIK
ncbi:MAG: DPP IV N-terminal domain-containing protein [Candidatus Latescibacteria bacterium]|nr:DPP IV N-terminal domain-containing protein [Candidatus Latescibacterota bacterium]